jgi:Zn-dependent membrane protease YugP
MVILGALGLVALLALLVGPHLWVQHVLHRAGADRPDLPGTGGELARHLLDEAGLQHVAIEETAIGDHYDPDAQVVRLLPDHLHGRSIAAVAVAAHEVAHAVQHAQDEPAFRRRTQLVRVIAPLDRIAQVTLVMTPFVFAAVRAPGLALLQLGLVLLFFAGRLAVHAMTLPVELDASFRKALPVLERGGYLAPEDLPQVRRVLRAAAMTYVASALMTLVNVARWFRP